MSRMSTDTPVGGLSYDEETWDVARVRHVENTWKQAGLDSLVAAPGTAKPGSWPRIRSFRYRTGTLAGRTRTIPWWPVTTAVTAWACS